MLNQFNEICENRLNAGYPVCLLSRVKEKYGVQWKVANVRDTSLQPYKTKAEEIEIFFPERVKTADVTVSLIYELGNPNQKYHIESITKRVSLDK